MTLLDALFGAFTLPFLARALLVVVVFGVTAALASVAVNLRGAEFTADALTHAVFPGLAIGLALGGLPAVFPGACIASVFAVIILTLLTRAGVASDAATAVVLTATFAIGVLVVSRGVSYAGDLEALLFGRILTVSPGDLPSLWIVCGSACLLLVLTLWQQLARTVDVGYAHTLRLPVVWLDLVLNTVIALVVVAGSTTVGSLLALAFILLPGAVARRLSSRLVWLVPIAVGYALLAGWLGLAVNVGLSDAAELNVPASATVVLVFLAGYVLALFRRHEGARDARRAATSDAGSSVAVPRASGPLP